MGRISWWEGFPGVKDFLVGRISWWEGIPGVKDFLVGRISWWEGIPGVKDFLVGGNSWRPKDFQVERFPDDKDFPVIRISRRKKISLWQVFPNSRGEGFPGGKNFLVGKMLTFITRSFLGQPKSKNHRNLSPAARIYWLIKLSVLPLNHKIPLSKILENCFRC